MDKQNVDQNERKKLLEEVLERLRELDDLGDIEDLIKNNTIEFEFNGSWFRVRKPYRQERQDIKVVKNKKLNELLKDPDNVVEEELIKILLKRSHPVDIPQLRQNIRNLQTRIDQMAVQLTESLNKKDRETLLNEIDSLRYQRVSIQYEIDRFLSSCVEKQLKDFIQEYIVYVILEKKTDEEWKRYFKTYEDFMKSTDEAEDRLIYKAVQYLAALLHYEDYQTSTSA